MTPPVLSVEFGLGQAAVGLLFSPLASTDETAWVIDTPSCFPPRRRFAIAVRLEGAAHLACWHMSRWC